MIEYVKFENANNGASVILNNEFYPMLKFESPVDVRTEDKDRMQDHGQWPTFTYLGKRLIRCEGDILALDSDDYIEKRRALIKALLPYRASRVVGNLTLRFSGMPEDLTAECTIDGMPELPIEALSPSRTSYQVTFKCFDPILYGKTVNIVTSDPTTAALGRTYSKTYPRTYASIAGIPGQQDAVNLGDVASYPTVIVRGPATGVELQHLLGEDTEVLSLPGLTLSNTDVLTVNFKDRIASSVELGDVYSYVAGTWWNMPPGPNSLRYAAFSFSGASSADFTWYNGYML